MIFFQPWLSAEITCYATWLCHISQDGHHFSTAPVINRTIMFLVFTSVVDFIAVFCHAKLLDHGDAVLRWCSCVCCSVDSAEQSNASNAYTQYLSQMLKMAAGVNDDVWYAAESSVYIVVCYAFHLLSLIWVQNIWVTFGNGTDSNDLFCYMCHKSVILLVMIQWNTDVVYILCYSVAVRFASSLGL